MGRLRASLADSQIFPYNTSYVRYVYRGSTVFVDDYGSVYVLTVNDQTSLQGLGFLILLQSPPTWTRQ